MMIHSPVFVLTRLCRLILQQSRGREFMELFGPRMSRRCAHLGGGAPGGPVPTPPPPASLSLHLLPLPRGFGFNSAACGWAQLSLCAGAWGHRSGLGTWTQTRDLACAANPPRAVRQGAAVSQALASPRGLHLAQGLLLLLAGHRMFSETPPLSRSGGTSFLHHPPGPRVAS